MICPTLRGKTFEEEVILYCPNCNSTNTAQDTEFPIVSYDKSVVITLKCHKCQYNFAFKVILYAK